jgi:4-amino-4-deoxy-L-arabinose transferase-like glycosyltransferase
VQRLNDSIPYLATVCAIGIAAIFVGLENNVVYEDEIAYRLIADSVRRGETFLFLQIPGGDVYFNKPPLYFWLSALAAKVFGPGWFAARFWSAMFGFGCLVGTYYLGQRLCNRRVGLLAVALSLILLLGDTPRARRVTNWGMIALLCGVAGWFKPLNGLMVWAKGCPAPRYCSTASSGSENSPKISL